MHPIRKKRLIWIAIIVALAAAAASLALFALRQNINLFFTPQQIVGGQAPQDKPIRVGGWVVAHSVQHDPHDLHVHFLITDHVANLAIAYDGVLPDLFREGQAVVVEGELNKNNLLQATEVLAKHDENYTPPPLRDIAKK